MAQPQLALIQPTIQLGPSPFLPTSGRISADVFLLIADRLFVQDLIAISLTCREWRAWLQNTHQAWRTLEFGTLRSGLNFGSSLAAISHAHSQHAYHLSACGPKLFCIWDLVMPCSQLRTLSLDGLHDPELRYLGRFLASCGNLSSLYLAGNIPVSFIGYILGTCSELETARFKGTAVEDRVEFEGERCDPAAADYSTKLKILVVEVEPVPTREPRILNVDTIDCGFLQQLVVRGASLDLDLVGMLEDKPDLRVLCIPNTPMLFEYCMSGALEELEVTMTTGRRLLSWGLMPMLKCLRISYMDVRQGENDLHDITASLDLIDKAGLLLRELSLAGLTRYVFAMNDPSVEDVPWVLLRRLHERIGRMENVEDLELYTLDDVDYALFDYITMLFPNLKKVCLHKVWDRDFNDDDIKDFVLQLPQLKELGLYLGQETFSDELAKWLLDRGVNAWPRPGHHGPPPRYRFPRLL